MSVRGSLDVVTPEYATGWAYSPNRTERVTIQAMLNREIIGEGVANLYRSDLAEVGLGDGNCGFDIKFYRVIDPQYLPFVVVRLEGSDAELPRWTPTGFVEFFKALYIAHPVAGRPRSVFGGLWSDRTDAAAILKGKSDIGLISEEDAAIIARLIHQGIIVFPDVQPDTTDGELSTGVISSVLNDDVVRVLQLILEDRAVVLSAEIVRTHRPIGQASAELQLPSPGECLVVLAPLSSDPVQVDVVRDSHRLPEFNRDGVSRWVAPTALGASDADLDQQGVLDRHVLPPNCTAIVGPGVLHSVRCGSETDALRLLVVPARGVPLRLLYDGSRQETNTPNGVRICL